MLVTVFPQAAADLIEKELKTVSSTGRIRQFGHAPEEILSFEDMAAASYSVRTLHREKSGPMMPSASVLVALSDQPTATAHRISKFFALFH